MGNDPPPPASDPQGSWHRWGLALVALLAVLLTVISTYRILHQVFAPSETSTNLDCATGTARLLSAVERARQKAANQSAGERAALADFRQALEPEWALAASIRSKCRTSGDAGAYRAYRAVEVLRYAEERAVRFEALDLSKLRNRAPQLVRALTPTPSKNRIQ